MKMNVKVAVSGNGFWSITCQECPLLPHLKALGQKSRPCASGMSTNVQGAIPLQHCEHYVKDSAATDDGKTVTVECGHKEPSDA